MVLEDHGADPMREEVRQTIGSKLSNNFGNGVTDFWKRCKACYRRAGRLLPHGKELCFSAAGYGPFLSAVLVAGL